MAYTQKREFVSRTNNGVEVGEDQFAQILELLLTQPQIQQYLGIIRGMNLGNPAIESTLTRRYPINRELEFMMEVDDEMKLIGKGSIYEIKDRGKWGVAYYYEDEQKEKKRKVKSTFRTEKEAGAYLDSLLEAYKVDSRIEMVSTDKQYYGEEYLIKNYLDYYLEEFKKGKVANSTYNSYRATCNNISRYIGDRYIQEITKKDIEKLFREMKTREKEMGKRKLQETYIRLNALYMYACENGVIDNNIIKEIGLLTLMKMVLTKIEIKGKKVAIITDENLEKLKAVMRNEAYRRFIEVLQYTGLRVSELGAIKMEHINLDFEKEEIIIKGSLTKLRKNSVGNGIVTRIGNLNYGIGNTKTIDSIRSLKLHDKAIKAIQEQLEYNNSPKEKKLREENKTDHLLFTHKGLPVCRDKIYRAIRTACKNNDIYQTDEFGEKYYPHPHMIRHSFATRLLKGGTPELVAAKLLGHKDTDMLKIYVDIDEELKEKAIYSLR